MLYDFNALLSNGDKVTLFRFPICHDCNFCPILVLKIKVIVIGLNVFINIWFFKFN